ncbi:MAG: hypothetical protein A3G75_15320 [Verrucomicrobia bacterium RIFCSPLOWO2_12_FULL_64_8]|nr:MAG: hypothetical protein A3G75_15320 [Verrucomicrobia bacterium RIFCSPLOWO2_12_FULL_64_8]
MSVTPASLEVGNVVLSGLLTDDERFALGEAAKSFESGAGVATDLPYRAVAFTRLLFHERLLNAVAEHLGPNVQYWGSCFFRANHVGTVPSEPGVLNCLIPLGGFASQWNGQTNASPGGPVYLSTRSWEITRNDGGVIVLQYRSPDGERPDALVPSRGMMLRGENPDFVKAAEFRW